MSKKNKPLEKNNELNKERRNLAFSNMFYSEQRIDLLIIAMSGAGIYVCLETIKFLSQNGKAIDYLIKLPGCFLLGAIIFNFMGQIFSKLSNEQDYLMCLSIDAGDECNEKKHDEKAERYTKIVRLMNTISMASMFFGLILLVIYFSVAF